MDISQETLQQATNLLAPHFTAEIERKSKLAIALYGVPVVRQIDLAGNPQDFTINLITSLQRYGNDPQTGVPTFIMLLKAVRLGMGGGHDADQLDRLIERVKNELQVIERYEIPTLLPFDKSIELKVHSNARMLPKRSNAELVSVPFVGSRHCSAFVVGSARYSVEQLLRQAKVAQLCLHFTRSNDDDFVLDVFDTIKSFYDPLNPFLALHIIGPGDESGNLSLTTEAHWLDAVRTVEFAVTKLLPGSGTLLQVFSQAPTALMMPLGRPFYRFYDLEMFNWIRDGDPPYQSVLNTRKL